MIAPAGRSLLTLVPVTSPAAAPAVAEAACEEASTPDEAGERAGGELDAGQRLFQQNDFRGAVERFRCSFELLPHEATLFKLAESAEAAGDLELALRTFVQYLEQHQDAEGRAEEEQRVAELERRVPAERGDHMAGAGSGEGPLQPGETRMSGARRAAWALLAAGVPVVVTGGVLYGVAAAEKAEHLEHCEALEQGEEKGENLDELDSCAATGQGLEARGWALMGVGLMALAASMVLFFVFDGEVASGEAERRAYIVPVTGGDGLLGLTANNGRF